MIRSKQIERPKVILVVDDQEINRDVLTVILGDEYEILYASNGQEALDVMRANTEELSIVLLDLMMPVMTGFEVLEEVRRDEILNRIPIIVLTADHGAELRALQAGAADFITKPFDATEVILARVGRIIELSEGRKLISAAEHDRLTGLYTRNFFYEYAERLYQYHRDLHLDAISLNVEQFHTINELHGREFGDDVLRAIGGEIRAFLSENDGIASRIEADRFQIFCTKQESYEALLKRFQDRVNREQPDVSIHLRMGVSPWMEGVEPVLQFDRAKTACNMVRQDFQHPLMIYDEEMHNRELLNLRLMDDLNTAVEEKQFVVYYQPKYNIQTNPPRLSSAEALVRWRHPELGMVSPGDFISLFENNGLIGVVDGFVWKEAAAQVLRWKEKYGITLPVSVNVSRSDMFDPTLAERLIRLIEDSGLEFGDIKLEVTESAYTENAQTVLEVIQALRDQGFDIEMDDFGSGYSSLNMLSDMPLDVLKMDMKFVRNIEKSEKDRRLVTLILDIARYLQVKVVAEGVETEGQMQILKDGGCNLVQGYYFSRPLPADEFEKLIEKEISETAALSGES
jgi:diguanylate cyclase (GGDEF)-like protein